MAIQTSSDAELRSIIFAKERVIVKFIDENCTICKKLAPSVEKFSDDPKYQDITFLKMDASENPVSSKEVKLSGTPFFATYFKGTLKDCGLLSSEREVQALLDTLVDCCD
ncbi:MULTISPECIES: thioredoxin family protein [Rufibacter]|uniref:Thiol-disulfide isomerase/thioredoxin n=1 Tax=Rufibacter quisquiliarum TaxID=1549639 RepID=A0A839GI91_9BACT|nr:MULTISPECIES: thioredoxin family protein [Rufibacter]MBA9079364.1 thiol-disulfide isomerase/thioredoxin [Rufibacter quisquiliarum]